jgi:hypothetical protein
MGYADLELTLQRRDAGAYSNQPWGGETVFLPWEDSLAMFDFPSKNPVKEVVKLKKVAEHTFRRIHKDDTLGETIVFELGPDGKAVHYKQHQNIWPRLR